MQKLIVPTNDFCAKPWWQLIVRDETICQILKYMNNWFYWNVKCEKSRRFFVAVRFRRCCRGIRWIIAMWKTFNATHSWMWCELRTRTCFFLNVSSGANVPTIWLLHVRCLPNTYFIFMMCRRNIYLLRKKNALQTVATATNCVLCFLRSLIFRKSSPETHG